MQLPYDGGAQEPVQGAPFLPEIKAEIEEPEKEFEESEENPEETYGHEKDSKDLLTAEKSTSPYEHQGLHACLYCRKKFKRHFNLQRHLQQIHSEVYSYRCPICNCRFKTGESLKFHMLSHEDSQQLYHCADCDFKSRKAANIKRHQIRLHANIYGYRCHPCSKIFKSKAIFAEHMTTHATATDEKCENEYRLTQPTYEDRDNRDDKSYDSEQLQCEEKCLDDVKPPKENFRAVRIDFQQFSNKSLIELDRDLNLLKGKKYLKCPQCKWRFRSTKVLNKHLKRHQQSFKCDVCEAIFKYRASFLKHKSKHIYEHKYEN